jgi:hypothetical protein
MSTNIVGQKQQKRLVKKYATQERFLFEIFSLGDVFSKSY